MAEMLVRVVDKVSQDEIKDVCLTKRGHVIAIRPDGHEWTKRESENPAWMIVREPKVSVEEMEKFLAPGPSAAFPSKEAPLDVTKITTVRMRRQLLLDISALPEIKSIAVEAAVASLEL